MVALVLAAGMFNVDKVTNMIGTITPVMILVLLAAALYGVANPPDDIAAAEAFARESVESPLPNWWLSTFNYIGLSMFSGIAMALIIGGNNWHPRTAGRGGFIGGWLFGAILIVMAVALIFQIDSVHDADLPTLALITEMNPALGIFASVATYLMIFSTALSFFDFTLLVANVFPWLGWLGIVLIAVLLITWLSKGRRRITAESRRRDKIRALILRRIDRKGRFSREDWVDLARHERAASVEGEGLRDVITADVVDELAGDPDADFDADSFDSEEFWADAKNRPLIPGEVRIVAETEPTAVGEEPAGPGTDAGTTAADAYADAEGSAPGDPTDR